MGPFNFFKVFAVLLLLCLCYQDANLAETQTSANFRQFLENALQNYGTWLSTAENADPTPQVEIGYSFGMISKKLFRLYYSIDYQEVVGLVKHVQERKIDQVYVDLIDLHFSVKMTTKGNITYQGNFTTSSGELTTGTKLEGGGHWAVVCTSVTDIFNFTFEVSKDGFVDISSRYKSPIVRTILEIDDSKTVFDGLWENGADGFAEDIRKQMGIEISTENKDWFTGHPTGTLLHRFLNETFQTASLSKIIGVEEEDQGTTEIPVPSTENVGTTKEDIGTTTDSTVWDTWETETATAENTTPETTEPNDKTTESPPTRPPQTESPTTTESTANFVKVPFTVIVPAFILQFVLK